jgi:hypothetical protein
LVNTPDIYKENKYQRRNLLLYQCLLESGLPKFNVSEQFYPNSSRGAVKRQDPEEKKEDQRIKRRRNHLGRLRQWRSTGGDHKPKRRTRLKQNAAGRSRFHCNTKIPVYSQGV